LLFFTADISDDSDNDHTTPTDLNFSCAFHHFQDRNFSRAEINLLQLVVMRESIMPLL